MSRCNGDAWYQPIQKIKPPIKSYCHTLFPTHANFSHVSPLSNITPLSSHNPPFTHTHQKTGIRPFRLRAMDDVTTWGISLCTAVFLIVSLGSLALVGPNPPADVLEIFSSGVLGPLLPSPTLLLLCCTAVRVSYLASVITIYPMQMLPFKQAAIPLLLPQHLQQHRGAVMGLVTVSMALIYLAGVFSGSIWVPLQLVGATAGALIAFVFPGMFALHPMGHAGARWVRVAGWALIVTGGVQGVAGVVSALRPAPHAGVMLVA